MSSTRASYTDCRNGTGRWTGLITPGAQPSANVWATLIRDPLGSTLPVYRRLYPKCGAPP